MALLPGKGASTLMLSSLLGELGAPVVTEGDGAGLEASNRCEALQLRRERSLDGFCRTGIIAERDGFQALRPSQLESLIRTVPPVYSGATKRGGVLRNPPRTWSDSPIFRGWR